MCLAESFYLAMSVQVEKRMSETCKGVEQNAILVLGESRTSVKIGLALVTSAVREAK